MLGKPVTLITELLNSLLVELAKNPSSAVVLGIVLGAMVGIDMGGPINKAAFFFGVTSIAQGNLQIMGIVSTSIAVAPLSMGIAAVVGKDKFTPEESARGRYLLQLLSPDTFFRQLLQVLHLLERRLLCAA